MLDIIDDIRNWRSTRKQFTMATVVETWRSAPRGVGASMVVDAKGKMIGSVSGGCVEGQVVKAALDILHNGGGPRILKFGVSNDDAWSVGLSCGGAISVLVQPFFDQSAEGDRIWELLNQCLHDDQGCVLIYGSGTTGFYSNDFKLGPYFEQVFQVAKRSLHEKQSQWTEVQGDSLFFHVFPPKNRLLIIGAAHITRDLVRLGIQQGFGITILDPRGLFYDSLTDLVDEESLMRKWPADILPEMRLDDSVYAVLLTHDPKIDDQALRILLNSSVAYIGALGSKKTHQRRVSRLTDAGFNTEQIDRIYGPVGLDIDANNPAEIALSIMAQIIQVKNGRN
ncbi:MAG: XdhC family protein [Saprospiraceae bacterium]|nr:XdhC family protein [Saprospiraceae bacterium]